MGHIELRDVENDDLDAIFDMMRDAEAISLAAFTAENPDDRDAFDAWIDRQRNDASVIYDVITENGGFAGSIAVFTVNDDREVSFWIARHAWGRGVASEALRILISREAERPLFARVAAHNTPSIAVLEKNGFTEVSRNTDYAPGVGREIEEIVFTLVPNLDGV